MKIISKLLFLIPLLFFSNRVLAQHYSVHGVISDSKGISIPGATLSLLSRGDSAYFAGTISDQNGGFYLKNIKLNEFIVRVTFVGYSTFYQNILLNRDIDLKILLNEKNNNLNEVVVEGSRQVTEIKGNTISFNINGILAKSSTDAFSLLNKAPGIVISRDDKIQLLGQTNLLFKLNGKRAFVDVDDAIRFLKSTPPSNIDRIEIQANAGAEYESNYSGVVNIITKEDLTNGLKATLNSNYNKGSLYRSVAGGNIYYIKNRLNSFLNVNYNHNSSYEIKSQQQIIDPSQGINYIHDNSRLNSVQNILGLKYGLDYKVSRNQSIGLVFGASFSRRPINSYNNTIFGRPNLKADSTVLLNEESIAKNFKVFSNLNYDLTLGNSNITSDLNFIVDNTHLDSYYEGISNDVVPFAISGMRPYRVATANLITSINHNLKNSYHLDEGFKFAYSQVSDNIEYNRSGELLLDNLLSGNSRIIYKEFIGAAYVNASKKFGKVNLSLGTRFEIAFLNGLIEKGSSTYHRTFPSALPTLSFDFPVKEKHKFNFYIKKSIARPNYSQLNSSILYVNPYTVAQGNINLKQYNIYVASASFAWLNKYIFTLRYDYLQNFIPQYTFTRIDSLFTKLSYDNIASGGGIQASLYVPLTLFKKWTSYNNFNYFNVAYKTVNSLYSGFDYHNSNFNASSSNIVSIGKNIYIGLDFSYSTGIRINQNFVRSTSSLDLSVSKNWPSLNLVVSAFAKDIFYQDIRRGYSIYNYTVRNFNETFDTRRFGLAFRYTFGKSKLANVKQHNTGTEEEESRTKYGIQTR